MENLNYVLFEEFKRLDKLCEEIYNAKHGITNYINDMKSTSLYNYRHIPKWNTDLEQLIRLRNIRNQLAHSEGAFYQETCTQQDIDWIQNFHKRILEQSDPLAMLYQNLQARTQVSKKIDIDFEQNNQMKTKINQVDIIFQESDQLQNHERNENNESSDDGSEKEKFSMREKLLLAGIVIFAIVIVTSCILINVLHIL